MSFISAGKIHISDSTRTILDDVGGFDIQDKDDILLKKPLKKVTNILT